MTNPITIERIADHVGERVTIRGWLYDCLLYTSRCV